MGLVVTSLISVGVMLLSFVGSAGLLATGASGGIEGVTPPEAVMVRMAWEIAIILSNAAVVVGAMQMMRLRSRNAALAACILALIPCCGPCFVLGIPFGAWGLYVLRDADVQAAFGRGERGV